MLMLTGLGLVLLPSDPPINDLLVEPPDPSNPHTRDLTLCSKFTDGDWVEFEILRHVLGCHDGGQV